MAIGFCSSTVRHEDIQCHCTHSDPQEHQHSEESPKHSEHSPDSCSICQLMMMQIDSPEILVTTHIPVLVEPVPVVLDTVNSLQPILREQARAPPFKTA
ncbi:MAG: hypothetical protein KAU94_00825 [Verrucomicrobia bacterium]|nr:hypothetical protein [Verrucomicrobiota bacterium]